ncbi:MAG: hybrid sensor histidine kinase/response regulator [Chloroflexi bacterium]|nr:hybrid sensor histidine kinase/response regulator [Chloroflexota bacterium]
MPKILVIEDELALLEEVLDILWFEDFEAIGAENGLDGVEKARQFLPDLIICDIMMPKLDGYGVLEELRAQPETGAIPFIFLTALADHSDRRKGMNLGADDFLTKPFSNDELLTAIRTRLDKQAAFDAVYQDRLDTLRQQVLLALPHELRTPLTGILGYAEILTIEGAGMSNEQVVETGHHIRRSALRLCRLVENYLMYIQLGVIGEDQETIELLLQGKTPQPANVIEQQAALVAHRVGREADLRLFSADVPTVQIFPDYLKKIVEELVDNAFKFSRPGTLVTVTTAVDHEHYLLTVSDHGRGMKPEQIASVGAYMQFERKLHEQQGSGMGLIIAQRLAEIHRGALHLESCCDQGTTVRVMLPLDRDEPAALIPVEDSVQSG